jgi:predicted TIM-barrel fold metal-dependent hydrolase
VNAIPTGAIDCDIHPGIPGIAALLPYMDAHWRRELVERGLDGFDLASYPPNAPISCRPDWRSPGARPGTDLARMQSHALNRFGLRLAICNPLYGGAVAVSAPMGAAICAAVNDWVAAQFLARDPRLRASIVVPVQEPRLAAAEIERKAPDGRFVQVLLPAAAEMMYGKSWYWPIYEAAAKHDLPVALHTGLLYRHAPTSNGWPSHHLQDYVSAPQTFEDQLLSLVSEGIFTRFPTLRIVLLESGVSWLPGFLWRAVKTWRGVRAEVPWVVSPPADLIRHHVRLSIQPFDAPADAIADIIAQIDCPEMFLFSTDYPHWQFEGDQAVPAGFPAPLLRKMLVENALATYPRLREEA